MTAGTAATRGGKRVALVTCAELPRLTDDDVLLAEALRTRGVEAVPAVWDADDVDWSTFAAAVIRSTWDYTFRRDGFVMWAAGAAGVTTLWNSPEVVAWNSDKAYLRRLADEGLPVVPTVWLTAGDAADLPALLAERGWADAVVKPAVSAGARGTVRVVADDAALPPGAVGLDAGQAHLERLLEAGTAMVQPFQSAVGEQGELSLMFVEGRFTHAVRKLPRGRDFRIQPRFGGREEAVEPPPDVLARAAGLLEDAMSICGGAGEATNGDPRPPLYARVDLLPDPGGPLLVELELIEPALFLRHAPAAADVLAEAVLRRIGAQR